MKATSLDITLVSPESVLDYASCWVRLEQILPDESKKYANLSDFYKLWLHAATGGIASRVRPDYCPVEFNGSTITAFLGFYVWPSNPGLDYILTSTFGKFSSPRATSARRSFSLMFDHQSRYALPYFMTNVITNWESPVFNAKGEQILPNPKVRLEAGIWLVTSEPCFGALRVSGLAQGKSVVLELQFIKEIVDGDDDDNVWRVGPNGEIIISPPGRNLDWYKLTDFKNVISVSYSCDEMEGGDGVDDTVDTTIITDQLDTVLPQCLEDVLSWCPGDVDTGSLWCTTFKRTQVYYNACTGDVLGTRDKSDKQSYCTKVDQSPNAGAGWLPPENEPT